MVESIRIAYGQKENMSNIHIIYKKPLHPNEYGIPENIIAEVENFITHEESISVILESEKSDMWENVGFDGAKTLAYIDESIKEKLTHSMKSYLKQVYQIEPRLQTMYIQKWMPGSSGVVHNDRYNFDGSIGNIMYRYAANVFLHSNFGGGNVIFPDNNISIKPAPGSLYMFPGGKENEHGVEKIEYGVRYTIVSFWDDANTVYTDEELEAVNKSRMFWAEKVNNEKGNGKI